MWLILRLSVLTCFSNVLLFLASCHEGLDSPMFGSVKQSALTAMDEKDKSLKELWVGR